MPLALLNIDLAATFLGIAGLGKPRYMDRRSLLPTFKKPVMKMRCLLGREGEDDLREVQLGERGQGECRRTDTLF